jgi:3-oxoacyl-[acyl-carrier protein] reductase
MMKKRTGTFVNIASVIGLMGNPGQANYGASKAGVSNLTKTTAKELAARGIRANAIAPGFIKTKMTDALTDETRDAMLSVIPMRDFGTPEDVANVALFLASDLSRYVTGHTLSVCGGMVTA